MADKRTDTYANDANQSRERLATTIDDLHERLSPRRIAGEAVGAAQERGMALARAAGEHKLALGLIGGAIGLLFLARKGATRATAEGDRALRRSWDNVRTTVTDATGAVGETAAEKWQQARERTSELAAKARYQATEASRLATENLDTNPLVGAVIGLTAGAVMGILLPRTTAEDELVGEHRDRFTDAARDAMKAAVDAGREQLTSYGLSADAAKLKLDTLKDQAADMAKSVSQAAAESFRSSRGGNA